MAQEDVEEVVGSEHNKSGPSETEVKQPNLADESESNKASPSGTAVISVPKACYIHIDLTPTNTSKAIVDFGSSATELADESGSNKAGLSATVVVPSPKMHSSDWTAQLHSELLQVKQECADRAKYYETIDDLRSRARIASLEAEIAQLKLADAERMLNRKSPREEPGLGYDHTAVESARSHDLSELRHRSSGSGSRSPELHKCPVEEITILSPPSMQKVLKPDNLEAINDMYQNLDDEQRERVWAGYRRPENMDLPSDLRCALCKFFPCGRK